MNGDGVIDVIIPTCRRPDEVAPLVDEIERTAGCPVNILATCQDASASVNRNMGLRWAQSDPRIMLDDDICDFDAGWVMSLAEAIEATPDCVMLSPQLMKPGKLEYALMMGMAPPTSGKPRGAGCTNVGRVPLLTACVVIRKDDILFDEGFVGSGWEDNAYCGAQNELYPNGFRVVSHEIQVVHRNEMKNQREHFERNRRHYESRKTFT